jgi:hypothetical protein
MVELSMCATKISHKFFEIFLLLLPNVRAVGASCVRPRPSPSQSFIARLDILILDERDNYLDTYLNGHPPPCLVLEMSMTESEQVNQDNFNSSPLPSYIRLYHCIGDLFDPLNVPDDLSSSILEALRRLTDRLQRPPSTGYAVSVILPTDLGVVVEQSHEMRELAEAVLKSGGDFIREVEPDWGYSSLITQGVRRWARRVKQEQML